MFHKGVGGHLVGLSQILGGPSCSASTSAKTPSLAPYSTRTPRSRCGLAPFPSQHSARRFAPLEANPAHFALGTRTHWALQPLGCHQRPTSRTQRAVGSAQEGAPLSALHSEPRQDRCPGQSRHRLVCLVPPAASVSAKITGCGDSGSTLECAQEPECGSGFVRLADQGTAARGIRPGAGGSR